MQNVAKFDKGHVNAMTEHVLYPKASNENQGQVTSMQGSIALACLIKNIYGKDISKQVKAIQALFQEYPQHLQDLSKFERTVLAEPAHTLRNWDVSLKHQILIFAWRQC